MAFGRLFGGSQLPAAIYPLQAKGRQASNNGNHFNLVLAPSGCILLRLVGSGVNFWWENGFKTTVAILGSIMAPSSSHFIPHLVPQGSIWTPFSMPRGILGVHLGSWGGPLGAIWGSSGGVLEELRFFPRNAWILGSHLA